QQCRDQRVLQNAEIALDGGPVGGGIARQACNLDYLAVEQRSHGKKPQERRKIADERLDPNFLAHVQLHVGFERRARIVGLPDDGNAAESQHATKIKVRTQFSRRERIHRDRKSTRLNSSHVSISYAVFCLKKK